MGSRLLLQTAAAAALLAAAAALTRCPAGLNVATKCPGGTFTADDCPDGYLYRENILGCALCPGCVQFKGYDETCVDADTAPSRSLFSFTLGLDSVPRVHAATCGPGLYCNATLARCHSSESTGCLHDLEAFRQAENPRPYQLEPECEPDGTYAAVQCMPSSGLCFCVTEEGERITGRDFIANKEGMNCACSRRYHKLALEDAARTDVTIHCLPTGNYEPLQCDGDVCFCMNSTTAKPYGGTVSRDQWTGLPCYSDTYFPGDYDRQCESMNTASSEVSTMLTHHGVGGENFTERCEADGGYFPQTCNAQDQLCRCRDRAGTAYTGYVIDQSHAGASDMNCRCARDKNDKDAIAYKIARNLYCDKQTGNYAPEQCGSEECFCVDGWGARASLSVNTKADGLVIRCCLPCYDRTGSGPNCNDRTTWAPFCPEQDKIPD